ncbi:TPA: site-specific integrase [Enterobacter asburiae]|uniref:Site-specific integrase n=1 Tax=Enterobacter cancerogenus TaxID=69218 RepID=A0ABX8KNN6_9ENTR|nr:MULTISPECIES: site-specific integrase [Enterobacter cloacae complex]DAE47002.1 MAG TPA: Integrase [Caudoviricetes sp.]KLG03599.1 recombinase [Enterobacter asburiae]MCZ9449035.1 site-specific integrase [Enterobacter asburiae]MDK9983316.1 site-specific integrase [Enterobacter asburiae]MDK9994880.1 site-specific integrase [Enterobacter asburiae]
MASTLLTDSKIRGLKPKKSAFYTWQASATRGTGRLGVKTYPSGRKTFVYRYFLNGKEKFVNLGDFPSVALAEAIEKASSAAKNISEPVKAVTDLSSIKQLFDDYIEDQKARGKRSYEKTQNRINQVLDSEHIDPGMLARDVTPDHIKRVLSEFISRGAKAGANKVRANLHAIFNFGLFADNDPANIDNKTIYGLERNPVSVVPAQRGVDKALDRFLPWDELSELLDILHRPASSVPMNSDFAQLLLCCIHTAGQRPWEIMTNTKSNWDKKGKVLTVPPEISKTGDYHVIPLSATATSILEEMEKRYPESDFLFPAETAEGHLLSAEYGKQLRKFCEREPFNKFTPRDIRRTFKTLAGDMGISTEMRDRLQNHKRPGVSAKHYDRYDYLKEKREIIEEWELRLLSLRQAP